MTDAGDNTINEGFTLAIEVSTSKPRSDIILKYGSDREKIRTTRSSITTC